MWAKEIIRREVLIKERYECVRNKPDPLHELNADQLVLTSMHILLSTSKTNQHYNLLQNNSLSYLIWFKHSSFTTKMAWFLQTSIRHLNLAVLWGWKYTERSSLFHPQFKAVFNFHKCTDVSLYRQWASFIWWQHSVSVISNWNPVPMIPSKNSKT